MAVIRQHKQAHLARLTLLALGGLLVWGLLPGSKPSARRLPPAGRGDAALYKKVVERLAAGEPYYVALGSELRADNYPTKTSFNWRTPAHLVFVARLSPERATVVLHALTLAAILATLAVFSRFGIVATATATIAQLGALATALQPDAVGVAEIWAGVLIALSACAYYRSWWITGAALAIVAIFTRELAAPYCAVCGLLALRKRRLEAVVWLAGGALYLVYYGLHAAQVQAHVLPTDLAHTQGWQQWNGLRFIVATVGVNGWLGLLPRSATVLFIVSALAGVAARAIPPQIAGSLILYFVLFTCVGLPFNYYWGFVTAPLWALAFGHSVEGGRLLVQAAVPTQPRTRA
jgi:hypothetical protein